MEALVYRLEWPATGMGPYRLANGTATFTEKLGAFHSWARDKEFPPPQIDGLSVYRYVDSARFACVSLEALRAWFCEGYLEEALSVGYVVKEYLVRDHTVGTRSGTQCAFFMDDVISERVLDLDSVLC